MKRFLLTVAASLALLPAARANVKLPSVLGSHMVVQRDKPLAIWGLADAGEQVTVKFGEQSETAKADDAGKWKVTLKAVKADGKPHKMTISGKNTIELEDILIGEVWVGSGQSNMEWSLRASGNPKETIAEAKHPTIRLFHVPKVQSKAPEFTVKAAWKECTPDSAQNFSAVLYNFGLAIQKELNVPIGLINTSWGGSPIEPWTVTAKSSGGMHNAMVAPLQPFAIRGILWYQGESNVSNGLAYAEKKKALIEGWRKTWGQETPFYFVQIAPFAGYKPGMLPPLWEAQVATLKIPHTGMAVTTDLVDNLKDIHPKNKVDVGKRLALWAMAKTYGKKGVVYSGPLYKSMKLGGGKATLSFAHVGGGLKARDDKALVGFEVAGEDGKFVPAQAVIEGDTVVVSAKDVASPAQVRFGWNNTANPNLANKEGLPASPFQTKDWKGGTAE